MSKIIAIGGGENGRPGTKYETKQIDYEIVKLSRRKNPKVLFIPPPSQFQENYFQIMRKVFSRLKCVISPLYLSKQNPDKEHLEKSILNSDIIYVGGGNTLALLRYWRKHGIDMIMRKAFLKGIVLSGLSAGAICWFKYGQSDSWKITNPRKSYICVRGLNFVNALCAPHFAREKDRQSNLENMMKKITEVGIALDDCCALEIIDQKYRLITSKSGAKAYKVLWKKGKYYKEKIKYKKTFSSLCELLKKS